MAGIDLSNIVSVGGKTVSSGIVSGLDVQALVKSLVEARSIPATNVQTKIDTDSKQVTALGRLHTLLDALNSASDLLRNPPGVGNASQDAFDFRKTSLSSNTSTAASSFLSATAAPGTSEGTYDFAVGRLARNLVERSGSFTSNTSSVVAAVATAGKFTAGTFYFSPVTATSVNSTVNTAEVLVAGDYAVAGAAGNSVLATGISNFVTPGDGDTGLVGAVPAIAGSFESAPTSELTLHFTINGALYTSNAIATDGGVSNQAIAGGTTITFTNAATGTAFDVVTGADYEITDNVTNVNNFIAGVQADISTQKITQARNLTSFTNALAFSPIAGLTQSNIAFTTDGFASATTSLGKISGFTITHVGANNNTLSVQVGSETFEATGVADTPGNIVLTSTTGGSNKKLAINFADAGVPGNFLSTQGKADAAEAALDNAFGTRKLTAITLNTGESLVDVAAAINAQHSTSGVSAAIIQVSSTDFRLQLSADVAGEANAFAIVDPGGRVNDGLGHGITLTATAAQDAVIAVNGIVTTRSTNTVNDVISGLTLNLTQVTDSFTSQGTFDAVVTPQIVSVAVGADTDTAKGAIINFINTYNDFRTFYSQQTARDPDTGRAKEDADLIDSSTLSALMDQASNEAARIVPGLSASFAALGNIGISLGNYAGDSDNAPVTNVLQVDTTVLDSALANNYEKVRQIFGANMQADSSVISLYQTSNKLDLTSFTLVLDGTNTVQVRDSGDNHLITTMTRNNTLLTGLAGSELEGVKLIYSGSGTDTVHVTVTQGIGDRLFNLFDPALAKDGLLDTAVNNVNTDSDRQKTELERVNAQIDAYRNQLLSQFSRLETAISKTNSILDFLTLNNSSIFGKNS